MIYIAEESQCCGCAACKDICPVKCIEMYENEYGFFIACANKDKCINCGKCEQICPMLNLPAKSSYSQKSFAAYSNDKTLRYNSASGGMFGSFAIKLIDEGYTVYGAAFDNNLKLRCMSVNQKSDLLPLMKSKYLQSDMKGIYTEIKSLLKEGQKVMFTGCPCQCTALRNYIGENDENLFLVEFFCHGVASQNFFDKCKLYDEKQLEGNIISYEFRIKPKKASSPHCFSVKYIKNNKLKKLTALYFKSTFYLAFSKQLSLRESCYICPFLYENRSADVTIGDFHNISNYIKGINRFDGVSRVIMNSEKGLNLWNSVKDTITVFDMDIDKLKVDKCVFSYDRNIPSDKNAFREALTSFQFENVTRLYMNPKKYRGHLIYYKMPRFLRNVIKKIVMGD